MSWGHPYDECERRTKAVYRGIIHGTEAKP
jgi:hypothetical protein